MLKSIPSHILREPDNSSRIHTIILVISKFCAYQTAPELGNDFELCKAQIPVAHFSGMPKNRALPVDFLKLCVTDNDSLWTDNKADYLRFRDPSNDIIS